MKESEMRLAMAISGNGTTMEAIAKSCETGDLRGLVKPVVVIASKDNIGGITRAQKFQIPVEVILRKNFPAGEEGNLPYGEALLKILRKYQPDIVTLNGFLVAIPENVIRAYKGNIFNQHPGPVPEFGGKGMFGRRVHAAVLIFNRLTKRDSPYTEVVAQRVDPQYDYGEVVKSAKVGIFPYDTVEDLQKWTLSAEHYVQIELLKVVAAGAVSPVTRSRPYVEPGEQAVLLNSREIAKILYPNG